MAELNTTAPNITLPGQNLNPGVPVINPAAMNLPAANLAQALNQNPVDLNLLNQVQTPKPDDDKKPETNLNEHVSKLQNFNRNTISIGELILSFPFVLSGFVNQSESIAKYGGITKSKNAVSFVAHVIEVISALPRYLINELVSHRESENDVKDVSTKETLLGEFFSKNIPYAFRRLAHPVLSKEFTALLFTFRRVIFNMFPDTFTVPSDDRDSEMNKQIWGRVSNGLTKTSFEASSRILSPFRWLTSIMAAASSVPSNMLGIVSAYTGNQELYNVSREFSKLSELFTPIVSNLSSLYSSAKAFIDSYTKPGKESISVAFGRYNISYLNVIQGSIGSLLSIPYFFGIFSKFKEVISEKDEFDKYQFVKHVKELVGESAPQIKSLGLFKNDSIVKMQEKAGNFTEKIIDGINKYSKLVLEAFFNSSALTKIIFQKVRPIDREGNVLSTIGPNTFESDKASENYIWGLDKKIFFKELFDLLHPIQSLLMLLPNAIVPLNDPYVADNAKRSFRIVDRLLGLNSMILTLPNYIIYALSTRIPQMILKINQMVYRMKAAKGIDYDPNQGFSRIIEFIKGIPSFGVSNYLAEILEERLPKNINQFTFKDEEEMANLQEEIEKQARSQEASVKSSELIGAIRIGMRTLLGQGWFAAQRDDATGYTDEEKSSMSIYNSLGTFKEGIYKFPVIGWIAGPFIEMFRRLYYVQPRTNLKRLSMV